MFKELLQTLATALSSAKIDYAVLGGQAVLQHGEPRATKDIDLTLHGTSGPRLGNPVHRRKCREHTIIQPDAAVGVSSEGKAGELPKSRFDRL